ncbi:MAG: GPW/gp25 family protein [Candidatus Altarchaeum sp.]|nr:GPW/gp25 family protein [Candidatus Altarchaeum sp.]
MLGNDLKLIDKKLGKDLTVNREGDIETVSGASNLGQAIVHRLMTRKGEISDLGHANYGSRLYELIGEPNNERTRELAKIYVKECIAQDPRVKEIVKVSVLPVSLSRIDILISISTIDKESFLNIVFPFYLEVA